MLNEQKTTKIDDTEIFPKMQFSHRYCTHTHTHDADCTTFRILYMWVSSGKNAIFTERLCQTTQFLLCYRLNGSARSRAFKVKPFIMQTPNQCKIHIKMHRRKKLNVQHIKISMNPWMESTPKRSEPNRIREKRWQKCWINHIVLVSIFFFCFGKAMKILLNRTLF